MILLPPQSPLPRGGGKSLRFPPPPPTTKAEKRAAYGLQERLVSHYSPIRNYVENTLNPPTPPLLKGGKGGFS